MRVEIDRVCGAYSLHSRSTRAIDRARPVVSSTSMSTLLNCTGPGATSKRRGMPSRKRPTMIRGSIPSTESRGPTMPVSVTCAVPCGKTRATGGVLAVHDGHVDAQLSRQPWKERRDRVAAGTPHHITDEEDAHLRSNTSLVTGGSGMLLCSRRNAVFALLLFASTA